MSALLANSARALSVRNDRIRAPLRTRNDVLMQTYPFTLAARGYDPSAVEPAIDALTMFIHHDKHHAAYVDNLNEALEEQPDLHRRTLQELLTSITRDFGSVPHCLAELKTSGAEQFGRMDMARS